MNALVGFMLEAVEQSSQIIYPPQIPVSQQLASLPQAHQQLLHLQQLQKVPIIMAHLHPTFLKLK